MSISLGNLGIDELEKCTGWKFTAKDRAWLEKYRQDKADINPIEKEFHIFHLPFLIQVSEPLSKELIALLTKYEEKHPASQTLQISIKTESEKQRLDRERKEQEQKEAARRDADPNAIWNVKWHGLVPITIPDIDRPLYFGFFINTFTTGKENIPDIIDGTADVSMTEEGIRGSFKLANPEKDNDADTDDSGHYIIGSGIFSATGSLLSSRCNYNVGDFSVDLREAIEQFESIKGYSSKNVFYLR